MVSLAVVRPPPCSAGSESDLSCDPAGTLPRCEERSVEVSAGLFLLGQHAGGEEGPAANQNVSVPLPSALATSLITMATYKQQRLNVFSVMNTSE